MRRGLMGRDETELPVAALEARLERLRSALDAAGLDALVVYTNNVRPSAVTWLTGFTPYWNDALLMVPTTGAPIFATALSKRVSEWIRTTDPISEIANSPKPGALIGQRLAGDAAMRRVGVLELDTLPTGLADDLAAAAPAAEWHDATALFAGLRRTVDDVERKLFLRADAIAQEALRQAEANAATDAATLSGLVEQNARLAGAEEAYIAIAPDLAADRRFNRISRALPLGARFAVRASVAYKGAWVRRARTFAADATSTEADRWFDRAVRSLESGKPLTAQIAAKVKELPGAKLDSCMAESCTGSYPLSVVAHLRAPGNDVVSDGQFLVLTVELSLGRAPWIGAAPTIVGTGAL
ncbi:MAG: hypothetical protein FJX62_17160 [Alphaproteobacteria bacterium]|nr:hypothetical protein [Alphaproteobacteria bacterium]